MIFISLERAYDSATVRSLEENKRERRAGKISEAGAKYA